MLYLCEFCELRANKPNSSTCIIIVIIDRKHIFLASGIARNENVRNDIGYLERRKLHGELIESTLGTLRGLLHVHNRVFGVKTVVFGQNAPLDRVL